MDQQTVTLRMAFCFVCTQYTSYELVYGMYTEQKMCTHVYLLWKLDLFVNKRNIEGEELHIIILRQKS